MAILNPVLEELRQPFKPDEVKQRPMKRGSKTMLDYVSIDATINRLLDVLGSEWSFTVDSTKVEPLFSEDDDVKYLAVVTGTLSALESSHSGVGADIGTDPDKVVKTALAEALKKAGHQLGVGLYLWDADERAKLALQRKAQDGDVTALKKLVRDAAVEGGAKATAEGIAEYHEVPVESLSDVKALQKIVWG